MSILRASTTGQLDTIMGVRLGLGSLGHDLNDAIGGQAFPPRLAAVVVGHECLQLRAAACAEQLRGCHVNRILAAQVGLPVGPGSCSNTHVDLDPVRGSRWHQHPRPADSDIDVRMTTTTFDDIVCT